MSLQKRIPLSEVRTNFATTYSTHGWDVVLSLQLDKVQGWWAKKWQSRSASVRREIALQRRVLGRTDTFDAEFRSPSVRLDIANDMAVAIVEMEVRLAYKSSDPALATAPKGRDAGAAFILTCSVGQSEISGRCFKNAEAVEAVAKDWQKESLRFNLYDDSKILDTNGATILNLDLRELVSSWEVSAKTDQPAGEFDAPLGDLSTAFILWTHEGNLASMNFIAQSLDALLPPWAEEIRGPAHEMSHPDGFALGACGQGAISIFVAMGKSGTPALPTPPSASAWKCCPVPEGFTSSILVGRAFFRDKIMIPGLKAAMSYPNAPAPTTNDTKTGFEFNIQPGPAELKVRWTKWRNLYQTDQRPDRFSTRKPDTTTWKVTLGEDATMKLKWKGTCINKGTSDEDFELYRDHNTHYTGYPERLEFWRMEIFTDNIQTYNFNIPFLEKLDNLFTREHLEGWRWSVTEFPKVNFKIPSFDVVPLYALVGIPCVESTVEWAKESADRMSIPYDMLLAAHIKQTPDPVQTRDPPVSTVVDPIPQPQNPVGPAPVKSYFDPLFADSDVLFAFLKTAATQPVEHLVDLCYNFATGDQGPNQIMHAIAPGPGFDARLIAGTYELVTPSEFSTDALFIDTLSPAPRVFWDDVAMERVTVNLTASADHHLSFCVPGSTCKWTLRFTFPLDDPNTPITFSGTVASEEPNVPPTDVTGYQIVETAYEPALEGAKAWDAVTWLASVHCLFGLIVWMGWNANTLVKSEKPPFDIEKRAGRCLFSFDELLRVATLETAEQVEEQKEEEEK